MFDRFDNATRKNQVAEPGPELNTPELKLDIEEAALLSDEVIIMGGNPLRLIKRCIPPKLNGFKSWQKLGLRKSLEVDSFQYYLKIIREKSYEIIEKGN